MTKKRKVAETREFLIEQHGDFDERGMGNFRVVHKPTQTETPPLSLYSENIEYIERELKQGRIHEDLTPFEEPFLEQCELAIKEENNFREAKGLPPSTAKVIRIPKTEQKEAKVNYRREGEE